MLVKLYYCVVKRNKLNILDIKDKDDLIDEIRNKILPGSFSDKKEMEKLFAEFCNIVKCEDMVGL